LENSAQRFSSDRVGREESLRNYMIQVYNYMASALVLTGSIAIFTASFKEIIASIYLIVDNQVIGLSTLGWVVVMAPIGIALVFSFKLNKMTAATAQFLFWTYSILLGFSLSLVFLTYTDENIASIFFITAIIFSGMSIYGYTTKADLTSLGSFLIMALIGILISSLVNIFFHNSLFNFILSIVGVFVFIGLTAFDTQRLKNMYHLYSYNNSEIEDKIIIIGALTLYLDFINIFVHLLQLFGKRKGR